MTYERRVASLAVEWGVEVWPDTDSPYRRVDLYPTQESAEEALRVYGSNVRLVRREWVEVMNLPDNAPTSAKPSST